ncbi:uncharacterized protein METZ01_LOCUS404740, partial [marine metagenome]
YFSASMTVDAEPQCNGDLTGAATVSVSSGSGLYSYAWDNGATTASISGVAAGTYCVVATDDSLGCVDTTCVTITEPSAMVVTGIILPSSTPVSNNGSVDLSVSGGTPCATSIQVGSGSVSSYLHRVWYTFYMDGRSQLTYEAAELAALGMNTGDIIDEFGWKILSQTGSAATWPMNGANLSFNGTNVWSGTHQAVVGLNNFVLSNPYTYTGGDLVVEWCFDNTSYLSGNNMFECTSVAPNLCISRYQDNAVGCVLTGLSSYSLDGPNAYIVFQAASGYTFA